MAFNSVRAWANKVFGKAEKPAEPVIRFMVTDAENMRALNPPLDNSVVETIDGIGICNPYRRLENLNSAQTAIWIDKQSRKFDDVTFHAQKPKDETTNFFERNPSIDLKGFITEQVDIASGADTKVPVTIIRRQDVLLDGSAALKLSAEGAVSAVTTAEIAHWVSTGGIFMKVNIADGQDAQNNTADLAACASYAIAQKYTSANRMAVQGLGHHGSSAITCALLRPELFKAAVAISLVTDHDCADIAKDLKHPDILIKTDTDNKQTPAWHSYKTAALLQARENEDSRTLLQTLEGSYATATRREWRQDVGKTHAFLELSLGPIDQNAYKAKLEKDARHAKWLQKYEAPKRTFWQNVDREIKYYTRM